MDPLSVASGCVSITAGIITLMMRITTFVSEVKGARKDMDAVHRELSSLQLCLNALRVDEQTGQHALPENLRDQVSQILVNIEMTMNQISDMLIKLSSGRLGRRIQWAVTQKDEMNKFRSSLESNKTALEIALTVGTISVLVEQKVLMETQAAHTADMISMTEQMTLTTIRMDGKIDTLLDLQKDKSDIAQIEAALHELREELRSMSHLADNRPLLEEFAQQSRSHVKWILQPLNAKVSEALDTFVAEREISSSSSSSDQNSASRLTNRHAGGHPPASWPSCVACSQPLREPIFVSMAQRFEELNQEKQQSLQKQFQSSQAEVKNLLLLLSAHQKWIEQDQQKLKHARSHSRRGHGHSPPAYGQRQSSTHAPTLNSVLLPIDHSPQDYLQAARLRSPSSSLKRCVCMHDKILTFYVRLQAGASWEYEKGTLSLTQYGESPAQQYGVNFSEETALIAAFKSFDMLRYLPDRSSKDAIDRLFYPITNLKAFTLDWLKDLVVSRLEQSPVKSFRKIAANIRTDLFTLCLQLHAISGVEHCFCEFAIHRGLDWYRADLRTSGSTPISLSEYEGGWGHMYILPIKTQEVNG